MRELALDGIPIPSLLVEQGGRHAAKPVPGHFRAAPAESPQSAVDSVLAHAPLAAARARKDVDQTSLYACYRRLEHALEFLIFRSGQRRRKHYSVSATRGLRLPGSARPEASERKRGALVARQR